MVGFETKKALLEHLGKNPSDNKLVDRMMMRGEVYLEDGMYYIVESEEVVKLKERIKELEKSDLSWELTEAKINAEYWENEARKYAQYCSDIVDVCYNKCKQVMWGRFTESREDFREWIQNMVKLEE